MQKSASLQVFQNKARQTSVRNEIVVLILLQAKGGVQLGSLSIPCVRDMKINLFLKNSGERHKHLNENENLHKLHFLHRVFLNGRVLDFFIWNEQGETFIYIQTDFFTYYIDPELSEIVF